MNKFLLTASVAIIGLGFATNAMADCNGIYLAGRAGATNHDYGHAGSDSRSNIKGLDKTALMLSGGLGYRYDYFRVEGEFVYRKKTSIQDSLTKTSFETKSYMLNLYYDLAPFHWISPYVNAGIGFTELKYSDHYKLENTSATTNGNYNPTRLTWSLGAGLTLKVTNRFNIDAGYRHYDMNSIKKMDVTDDEVYGGIRYVF